MKRLELEIYPSPLQPDLQDVVRCEFFRNDRPILLTTRRVAKNDYAALLQTIMEIVKLTLGQ